MTHHGRLCDAFFLIFGLFLSLSITATDTDTNANPDTNVNGMHKKPVQASKNHSPQPSLKSNQPCQQSPALGRKRSKKQKEPITETYSQPWHFSLLTPSRIMYEQDYFLSHHFQWSQYVVLETFYHRILGTSSVKYQDMMLSATKDQDIPIGAEALKAKGNTGAGHESISIGSNGIPIDLVTDIFEHPITGRVEKIVKGLNPAWDVKALELQIESELEVNNRRDTNTHENHDNHQNGPKHRHYGVAQANRSAINQIICDVWDGITCHERSDNGMNSTCWCVHQWEIEEYYWAPDSDDISDSCRTQCHDESDAQHILVGKNQAPLDAVTRIQFQNYGFVGAMIPDLISHLKYLERIEMGGNRLVGNFPPSLGELRGLKHLDLSDCAILNFPSKSDGVMFEALEELILADSYLGGTIPDPILHGTPCLKYLDLSNNELTGTLPLELFDSKDLEALLLHLNEFTGVIPAEVGNLASLKKLDLGSNALTGTIVSELMTLPHLESIHLAHNYLEGTIPSDLVTDVLIDLDLSNNRLIGSIPRKVQTSSKNLRSIHIEGNKLTGKIDQDFCESLQPTSKFPHKHLPPCHHRMACPRGYFHHLGFANETEACAKCPPCHSDDLKSKSCSYIGQKTCSDGTTVLRGDMDGDGALSEREIVRLIYMLNEGHDWSKYFAAWGDMSHKNICTLEGIDCTTERFGISLRNAHICPSRNPTCGIIPSEVGLLKDYLYFLDFGRDSGYKTPLFIPTEIGQLSKLNLLDVTNNLISPLPSEIGNCKELHTLIMNGAQLRGTLEDNVWNLHNLKKLDIRGNQFSDQNLSKIIRLSNLQEFYGSRSSFTGTIPSEIGTLKYLSNLELWGNDFVGTIPRSIANLKSLTRIDLYNNQLTGSVEPLTSLPRIGIIHLKDNHLSGTIPASFGMKSGQLIWLDLSNNQFEGEIPSSLGSLPNLKDLHLGNNRLFAPISESLCNSKITNGGKVGESCDHILCPFGTYSEHGFARKGGAECIPCAEGETTMFMGQTSCTSEAIGNYIKLLYNAIYGAAWVESNNFVLENSGDECKWKGIKCDDDNDVKSIEFSISNLDFDEDLFIGRALSF